MSFIRHVDPLEVVVVRVVDELSVPQIKLGLNWVIIIYWVNCEQYIIVIDLLILGHGPHLLPP